MDDKNYKKIKQYSGDGLLRYCLGKIFLNDRFKIKHIQRLETNYILSKIVKKNSSIFNIIIKKQGDHTLGSVYEEYLYDICEKQGLEKVIEFVRQTYEITNERPNTICTNWIYKNI